MDSLEARELRYFVAVAEELNFSRAAERLGMAQPPLSRAIRQIERRLGAELFHRDTRQVELTDFGATVLDDARYALDVLDAVARRARRAAHGTPALVATAKPGIATGLLQRIVDAYATLPGTPYVEIVVSGYRDQADMIRDGRADLALLSSPHDHRGLDSEPLATEPRVAALPVDHPLTQREELQCRDLDGEPIPQWPQSTPAEIAYWSGRPWNGRWKDHISSVAAGEQAGPLVADSTQLLEVISLGQAVALIPMSLADRNPRPDIVYRPVLDASPYVIAIAWPEGSRAQAVAQFVRTAMDLDVALTMAG